MARSFRAKRRASSLCLIARSPPPWVTASYCETRRRSALSAAAASSTCDRPRESAGQSSVWLSSMRTAIEDPARALAALLNCAPGYVGLTGFARDRALSADEVERAASELTLMRVPVQSAIVAMSPARWLQLKRGILDRLTAFHADKPDVAGMGAEALRRQLELRLPAPVFAAVLQALARVNEVALDGAWVRLPRHQMRLTADEETLWRTVRPLLVGKERFRPPRVRDVSAVIGKPEGDVRRLCKLLGRLGEVDEVAPDHFFVRSTVAEMAEIARRPRGRGAGRAIRRRGVSGSTR